MVTTLDLQSWIRWGRTIHAWSIYIKTFSPFSNTLALHKPRAASQRIHVTRWVPFRSNSWFELSWKHFPISVGLGVSFGRPGFCLRFCLWLCLRLRSPRFTWGNWGRTSWLHWPKAGTANWWSREWMGYWKLCHVHTTYCMYVPLDI